MAKEKTLRKEFNITQEQAEEHICRLSETADYVLVNPELGHCWERNQSLQNGYPGVTIQQTGYKAHRIACIAQHGHAPTPHHHAAHLCNNPTCINPDHLAWKTPKENARDRLVVEINDSGLSEGDVCDIFIRGRAQDLSFVELATEFAISIELVKLIVTGKKWSQITKHLAHKHDNTPYQSVKKISDHDAAIMICLKQADCSAREIEMAFGHRYNWNTLRGKCKGKYVATFRKQKWDGSQLLQLFDEVSEKLKIIMNAR